MQVLLNTDPHTDGRREMAEHVATEVRGALDRFGEQVTRVEVHLSDANSHHKANPDEIHCHMEARLVGLDSVVTKDHAATAHQAIRGAVSKLQGAVATSLAKHGRRQGAARFEDLNAGPTTDPEP